MITARDDEHTGVAKQHVAARASVLAAAYILFRALRRRAAGTTCADAHVTTLHERLLKVAVWLEHSVRRIVLHFLGTSL